LKNLVGSFCYGEREEVKDEMIHLDNPEKKCKKWSEHEDYILIDSLTRSLP
jgi:hypothetical protein